MNLDEINFPSLACEQSGHVISTQESIILHNSLLILQNENHFRKIYFWGRINGIEKDYYVAYGYTKDILLDRVYYYSRDCRNWGLLPKPKDHAKILTPLCMARFQGDPALVLDILIDKDETNYDGKEITEPFIKKLKEEDRLAQTINWINAEAHVVLRSSVFRRPDGVIVENRTFEGLTPLEAREYANYLHLRVPTRKWNTNLLTRDDYNYAFDFLDPLDMDIPEGCWINQYGGGDTFVSLKSLYWQGMQFYHYLTTPKYGYIYVGNGRKCLDVPFLLNIDSYKLVLED